MFPIHRHPHVAEALEQGRPVVALESTLLAHGLPRPGNFETGRDLEEVVRRHGAIPATIALLDGVAHIGLSGEELRRICDAPDLTKLSLRDLPIAAALGRSGATTVAGTAALASAAGISLFATGGLGGVHRGARDSFDESADLDVLARTRIVVVCAGVKSILDVPATLERLETLGVPVLGYGTRSFPGFYLSDSGHLVDWRVDSPAEVAAVLRTRKELGTDDRGLVLANPLPPDVQVDPDLHERLLRAGLAAAEAARVRGKDVTPFLLDFFHRESGGVTLEANIRIVLRNADLAARVASETVAAAG